MSNAMLVLVIDDCASERRLILEASAEYGAGLDLHFARNAPEAEVMIDRLRPQVVLLDLFLGSANGRELLPRLRGTVATIVLTGSDDPGERELCLVAGATAFWQKPLQFDEFRHLFQRIREFASGGGELPVT